MSYPQPRPAFPDAAFPQPNAGQSQQQSWQQAAPAVNVDFWTPPSAATQPQMPTYASAAASQQGVQQNNSPPQPIYAEPWQQEGARQRPVVPSHYPGGAAPQNDGMMNSQPAFMPAQLNQVMANPMTGMALDFGKQALGKNVSGSCVSAIVAERDEPLDSRIGGDAKRRLISSTLRLSLCDLFFPAVVMGRVLLVSAAILFPRSCIKPCTVAFSFGLVAVQAAFVRSALLMSCVLTLCPETVSFLYLFFR